MRRDGINYLAVGSSVLAALLLLLYYLYRITGGVGENDPYHVYYGNVGGLSEGTPVTYQGYKMGSVTTIEPEIGRGKTRYRVNMLARDGWVIPVDSVARIYSEGLLAETVINIEEGESSDHLSPGSEISGRKGVDMFAALGELADNVGDLTQNSARPLLDNLNERISSLGDQVDKRLLPITEGLQKLIDSLQESANRLLRVLNERNEEGITNVVSNSSETSRNLLTLSQRLNGMLDDTAERKLDAVLNDSNEITQNLVTLTKRLLETQAAADNLIKATDGVVTENRTDLRDSIIALRRSLQDVTAYSRGILQNMDGTARNMNEFSRQIRDNPALLLGGKSRPEEGVADE